MDKQTKWVVEKMFSSNNNEKKEENMQKLQINHETLKDNVYIFEAWSIDRRTNV